MTTLRRFPSAKLRVLPPTAEPDCGRFGEAGPGEELVRLVSVSLSAGVDELALLELSAELKRSCACCASLSICTGHTNALGNAVGGD